jgi:WD40-like Beta Propeller Repeat
MTRRILTIALAAVAIVAAITGGVYALTGPSGPSQVAVPPVSGAVSGGTTAPLANQSLAPTQPAELPAPPRVFASLRPSGPPKFVVVAPSSIVHFAHRQDKEPSSYTPTHPVVQDATTGKVLATIPLPPGIWSSWLKIAAAPDDRTFVIGGLPGPTSHEVRYFRVHLDDRGRPETPTVVPGLSVPDAAATTPALSPDGRRLAFSGETSVSVIDVVTGQQRSWALSDAPPTHLAWAPDGRSLGLIHTSLRTLDTWSATARPVDVALPAGIGRGKKMDHALVNAAYTPDGKALIADVGSTIERVPLHGGSPKRLAKSSTSGTLSVDGTGRYALYPEDHHHRFLAVDLKTGHRTKLPVPDSAEKSGDVSAAW